MAGIVMVAAGALGPWITGTLPDGDPRYLNGLTVGSDGGIALLFAGLQLLVLGRIAAHRGA